MELAEVYRVIYHGPDDRLRGLIVSADTLSLFQYLFKDKGLDNDVHSMVVSYTDADCYRIQDKQLDLSNKPLIRSGDHIMLNGPTEASIDAVYGLTLSVYLFGVIHCQFTTDFPYFEPEMLSYPLKKLIMAKDGSRFVTVLYALFENGVEARLDVKLSNVKSVFDLFGIINARTSAIKELAWSSILFFKDFDEKIEVGSGHEIIIPLARPLVAVPLGSQLILQFSLSMDDNDKMVEDTMVFEAKRDGASSKTRVCSKGLIEVEVSWRSTRKYRERKPDEYETDSD